MAAGTLRLLFEDLLLRFAAADTDGRKTCSNQRGKGVSEYSTCVTIEEVGTVNAGPIRYDGTK